MTIYSTLMNKHLWGFYFVCFNIYFYLFIYLAMLGVSCSTRIFDLCYSIQNAMQTLSCGMWDLVPWPGIKARPLLWKCGILATGPPGSPMNTCLVPSIVLGEEAQPCAQTSVSVRSGTIQLPYSLLRHSPSSNSGLRTLTLMDHTYRFLCSPTSGCMLSSFSHVQLFAILWAVAHQVPLSIRFSRQEY